MKLSATLPTARDKLLFTPGPLTTSLSVKSAMLHDAGSWHFEFNALVRSIRDRILRLAGLEPGGDFDCVPMQGTGTFGVESVIGSVIPPNGKLLVLSNGAYGDRMVLMASALKIAHTVLRVPEETAFSPVEVERALKA